MAVLPFAPMAVVFDFDGTLTRPEALDFLVIRKQIGCPAGMGILEFIDGLESPGEKEKATKALQAFEMEAAALSHPNPGAQELVAYLKRRSIPMAVVTRNDLASLKRALENFDSVSYSDFTSVVTRDDPYPPKPDPAPVAAAISALGVEPGKTVVVGDFVYDIHSGQRAGAYAVLLDHGLKPMGPDCRPDHTIHHLSEMIKIFDQHAPLKGGKLPSRVLESLLSRFGFQDPSVIVNPGIGEDTAAVDIAEGQVLVLTSDPITFATDSAGRYAVLVNANDIATSGARPQWLLTALLFPVNTTCAQVEKVMHDLSETCREHGITLCGGHTEITDAVSRPVITGTMAGTVDREKLIEKNKMEKGHHIFLTKGVCVEGTAIMAREFGDRLTPDPLSLEELEQSKGFLSHISVLEEARIAARIPGVSAMHDVTEGGLASAVAELSAAGGHKVLIQMDKIPVYDQTRKICRAFGLDPLGLIGSGSLLICCDEESSPNLAQELEKAGVSATKIGVVGEKGGGVAAQSGGRPADWPVFEVDEITRLFG